MDDLLKKWLKKHNVTILNDTKKIAYARPVQFDFFLDSKDYNIIHDKSIDYEFEPLYVVEVPLRELNKLAEFENQCFKTMEKKGHFDLFLALMEQKEEEKRLRNKYPAVAKAYEHYSTMLAMAKSDE